MQPKAGSLKPGDGQIAECGVCCPVSLARSAGSVATESPGHKTRDVAARVGHFLHDAPVVRWTPAGFDTIVA